ncbi:MAG: HAMP domain-containing sensor histidine kinase [Thermaerobacterales bacterium]
MQRKPMFLGLWALAVGLSLVAMIVMAALLINLLSFLSDDPTALVTPISLMLVLVTAGTLSLSTGTAWFAARRLAQPLEHLTLVAGRMAAGERTRRAPETGYLEAAALGHSLNRMAADLDRHESRRREFVASVAHELRTPLTHLQGYSRSLLDGVVTAPDDVYRHLLIIDREAGRLGRLVNDLLDLEALSSGQTRLNRQRIEFTGLASDTVTGIAPAAQARSIEVSFDRDPDLPPVDGDADRLQQVLWNLFDNALKHTEPGGRVWLEARQKDGGVQAIVHDTGRGLDPDQLPVIWESFYTGDPSRSRQRSGYGLGLAMAKQIIELHGGHTYARTVPGRGASIGFWLPPAGGPEPGRREEP